MTTEIFADSNGTIRYYKDGLRHREDGPAIIWADGDQWWYLNGTEYSFDVWCRKLNISDAHKTLLMLKYSNTQVYKS